MTMNFNDLVKKEIGPILEKHEYALVEEMNNFLRFESLSTRFEVSFDVRDRSLLVEFGRPGGRVWPLNNDAVKKLLFSNLAVENVVPEVFVKNLASLLETKQGSELLNGKIEELKNFIMQQSREYTESLRREHLMSLADKAWEEQDFVTFIKCVDQIGIDHLTRSYKLKYKIAKRKL